MHNINEIFNNSNNEGLTGKLITLVDPDNRNVRELVEELIKQEVPNIWIGCSNSSVEDIRKVFEMFPENMASLYPGNDEHIRDCLAIAKNAYPPNPLNYRSSRIDEYKSGALEFLKEQDLSNVFIMDYVVLSPDSSVGRALGLTEPLSDKDVLELLNKSTQNLIYLEAGSGNTKYSIVNRTELIEAVRKGFPDKRIISAGGITTPSEARELSKISHYVLVSSAIHNDPSSVSLYLEAVKV